jgi:hypothetical protein
MKEKVGETEAKGKNSAESRGHKEAFVLSRFHSEMVLFPDS